MAINVRRKKADELEERYKRVGKNVVEDASYRQSSTVTCFEGKGQVDKDIAVN
jgi:hypothetical protein